MCYDPPTSEVVVLSFQPLIHGKGGAAPSAEELLPCIFLTASSLASSLLKVKLTHKARKWGKEKGREVAKGKKREGGAEEGEGRGDGGVRKGESLSIPGHARKKACEYATTSQPNSPHRRTHIGENLGRNGPRFKPFFPVPAGWRALTPFRAWARLPCIVCWVFFFWASKKGQEK